MRPFVRDAVPEWLAKGMREFHPLRVQYWVLSDKNPMMWPAVDVRVDGARIAAPALRANDNVAFEKLASEHRIAALDLYRDLRDATSEAAFFEVYGNMMSLQMADQREAMRSKRSFDPRSMPAVREVLDTIEEGSVVEGVARIAMLISKAGRGHHRLSQMQKTRELRRPKARSRTCPRTRAGACCRKRRSSWSSSRSAPSDRCRSSCALRPTDGVRMRSSSGPSSSPGSRIASAAGRGASARCCRLPLRVPAARRERQWP